MLPLALSVMLLPLIWPTSLPPPSVFCLQCSQPCPPFCSQCGAQHVLIRAGDAGCSDRALASWTHAHTVRVQAGSLGGFSDLPEGLLEIILGHADASDFKALMQVSCAAVQLVLSHRSLVEVVGAAEHGVRAMQVWAMQVWATPHNMQHNGLCLGLRYVVATLANGLLTFTCECAAAALGAGP